MLNVASLLLGMLTPVADAMRCVARRASHVELRTLRSFGWRADPRRADRRKTGALSQAQMKQLLLQLHDAVDPSDLDVLLSASPTGTVPPLPSLRSRYLD
jgi:hypothetical protein